MRVRWQCHHTASVAQRNFSHDGQAQAAATGQFTGAPEALEHMQAFGLAQAGAVVFDLQQAVAIVRARAQLGRIEDERQLRGVDGLRVIDASVIPRIPSAATHAPVIAIAERAADLLLGHAPAA